MNNCHCDGLCKAWTDAGIFHKVHELYQEGVDVYQYLECLDTQDESRDGMVNKQHKRVLVLQNKSKCEVSMNSIIEAIEYKNIKCKHCYEVLYQTVRLLNALNILKKHEVIGICDHCKKIIKNSSCKCKHSIEAMRTFLNCRLRDWFRKTGNVPCATRRKRFSYDEIKRRASSKSERFLEIDELFPEYSNILQRSKSVELQSPKYSTGTYLNVAFKEEQTEITNKIIVGTPKELSKERVSTLDIEYIKSNTVDSKKDVLESQKRIKKQRDITDEQDNVSYNKSSDNETKEIKMQTKDSTIKEEKEKNSKTAEPSQVNGNNNIVTKAKTTKGLQDSLKPEKQTDKHIISKISIPEKGILERTKKSDNENSDDVFKMSKPRKETMKDSKQKDKMDNNYNVKLPKTENGITKDSKQKGKDKDYVLKLSKTERETIKDFKQKNKTDNNSTLKLSIKEKGATKVPKKKGNIDEDSFLKLSTTEKETAKRLKQKNKIENNSILKLPTTEKRTTNGLKQKDKFDNDSILKLFKIEKETDKDLKQNVKINEQISKLPQRETVSSKPTEIFEKHIFDFNLKPDSADEIVLKQMKAAKELKEKALEVKEREKALEAIAREMKAQEKFKQEQARKQKADIEPSNVKKTLTATASQMYRFQEQANEQRTNISEIKHKTKSVMSSFNEEIIKRLGLDILPKIGKIKEDGNISLLEFMKPTKKMQIQRIRSAHYVSCTLLDETKFLVRKRIKKNLYNFEHSAIKVPAENSDIFGTGDGKILGANKLLEDVETNTIILGADVCKYNMNLLPKPEKETTPLLFEVIDRQQSRNTDKEINGYVDIKPDNKNIQEIRAFHKKLEHSHLKVCTNYCLHIDDLNKCLVHLYGNENFRLLETTTAPATDIAKGVIRYALSDRKFIENGWTMLPTQKVVRKMNIYRMNPARPENDWFNRNKERCPMAYESGEKLAEVDESGNGRWFYKNGLVSLDYYSAEEMNAQRRIVVYSSRLCENATQHKQPRPTILACFDWLGNGVVYDDRGNIRLKYNQTEGVLMDKSLGPPTYWKWHSLNDPPVLQQVLIDTKLPHKNPEILKHDHKKSPNPFKIDNDQMLAIEHENFLKEKRRKLAQKFKPYQIKSKALKINDQFSLRVLDQATVYLLFRDGKSSIKLNLGMSLDPREIMDTETTEVGEVTSSYDRHPAKTKSLANIQRMVISVKKNTGQTNNDV